MGSIISALRHGKPIVVMPRRAVLGEHRNEHQNATAARFADRPGIFVSSDEITLPSAIERALAFGATAVTLPQYAESRLLNSLRRYILTGDVNADIARDGMARNSVD
jgi:UDP-N-acetylglucosamine transferase subunit ALG13